MAINDAQQQLECDLAKSISCDDGAKRVSAYNEATKAVGDKCVADALACFQPTGLPLDDALKAHLNAMNNYYFRADLKDNQANILKCDLKDLASSNAALLQEQCDDMKQYVECQSSWPASS